jgi:hypothetical protein
MRVGFACGGFASWLPPASRPPVSPLATPLNWNTGVPKPSAVGRRIVAWFGFKSRGVVPSLRTRNNSAFGVSRHQRFSEPRVSDRPRIKETRTVPTNASDATREYGQSRSAREVWGALTGACIMLVAHQRLSNDFFFLESSAICEALSQIAKAPLASIAVRTSLASVFFARTVSPRVRFGVR